MHHALEIQEILLNIFSYCRLPTWQSPASDLPALARTCHAFKEPALDVLWEKLVDPSPLAKCLPDASHYSKADKYYSFSRSLTQIEWEILRSYTRRIRSMADNRHRLDWESVGTFLNPPPTEPLFPNLCHLHGIGSTEIKIKHLLSMPFPSLISLESFSKFSPNIRRLSTQLREPDITFSKFFSSCIYRWRDLRDVDAVGVTLDVDALAHLSCMPALTQLRCTLSAAATFRPSDSYLFFSNLHHLTLYSEFLEPISRLLSQTRLPAITDFCVYIESCPSKRGFSSFLVSVQTSAIGHTIQGLVFFQLLCVQDREDATRVLGFEDLQPCMAFSNLRRLDLDLTWDVDLTDSELLTLASGWPHMEHLLINTDWGWNTLGGITPNGLLQLLQTCPSLSDIALAIDTRDYAEFRESPASLGLTLPPTFSINVVDSLIEEESVPAIAAFLAGIAPCPDFEFSVGCWGPSEESNHEARWYEAYEEAKNALSQCS